MLNMSKRWAKKYREDLSFVGGSMWSQLQLNQMNTKVLQSVTNQGPEVHTPGESALNGEIQVRPALQFNTIKINKPPSFGMRTVIPPKETNL